MSEHEAERRIEAMIENRLSARAGQSPAINRLMHQTDAEHEAVMKADTYRAEVRCRCYPPYWERLIGWSVAECIANVVQHRVGCPRWVDPDPMYSRAGDALTPGYTRRQERADAEAEQVDGRGFSAFGRIVEAD